MPDVQIHLNAAILFSAIGILLATVAGLAWWSIREQIKGLREATNVLSKKLDGIVTICGKRATDCVLLFVTKLEFGRWQEGRNGEGGVWEAINYHHHAEDGGVVRDKKK